MEACKQQIEAFLKSKPIAIFMKGTPEFPMCGFSAKALEVLSEAGVSRDKLAAFNVLEDRPLFEYLKQYSKWPTSPQVYVNGKLVGGCDIVCEMAITGELKSLVQSALSS